MTESPETIMGKIPVSARLTVGSELLTLFFTSNRIIAARVGKRGLGEQAPSLLGKLAATFEDLFKGGKESVAKRGLKSITPDEILASGKENFAMLYEDVVSVEVEQTFDLTKMIMLTKEDKFEFSTKSEFEKVLGLLERTLSSKLSVRRLASGGPSPSK